MPTTERNRSTLAMSVSSPVAAPVTTKASQRPWPISRSSFLTVQVDPAAVLEPDTANSAVHLAPQCLQLLGEVRVGNGFKVPGHGVHLDEVDLIAGRAQRPSGGPWSTLTPTVRSGYFPSSNFQDTADVILVPKVVLHDHGIRRRHESSKFLLRNFQFSAAVPPERCSMPRMGLGLGKASEYRLLVVFTTCSLHLKSGVCLHRQGFLHEFGWLAEVPFHEVPTRISRSGE